KPGADHAKYDEECDEGEAVNGREIAAGEGADVLSAMTPIGLDVEEVVKNVGCGCREAEGEERDGSGEQAPGAQIVREKYGEENEGVLRPLVKAGGFEKRR